MIVAPRIVFSRLVERGWLVGVFSDGPGAHYELSAAGRLAYQRRWYLPELGA